MKILFINKYDITGGAGITANRLANALEKYYKTENHFLVGIKKSDNQKVFTTRSAGLQNTIERSVNLIFNAAGLQYKWLPFSTKKILEHARDFKPDVISLHNIHGGYFKTSLLTQLSKIAPIYWTLHDMWAFTANAAHTYGDESWKKLKAGRQERKHFPQIGLNTGNWLLKNKKRIYAESHLTIITPSVWLYNLAKQSPVFEGKKICQIYNGVDTEIFYPHNKINIRKELNIPVESPVLVFGAENVIRNAYKGGEDLLRILQALNESNPDKIHLIILGMGDFTKIKHFNNLILHEAGYIFDEKMIPKYLAAADLMIYPTKADNLPNALIEAAACGIPAVTYDVGGCSEIIKDDFNGYVIPSGNLDLFVNKAKQILYNKKMNKQFSINARNFAVENFSISIMAEKYKSLFFKEGGN